jgi:tetratricopeptide (TPR) repeat protein
MSTKRLEQLMGMLEASPNEPFILFAVAKEHEGLDNKEKALEFYTKLENDCPDYVGTYYHLGKLYVELGEDQKAFSTYKKGIIEAKKVGDQHSLSELSEAKMGLDHDDDDDDDDFEI